MDNGQWIIAECRDFFIVNCQLLIVNYKKIWIQKFPIILTTFVR